MNTRGDVLTFGVLFALYFASSGVESLRIGLNRAYDMAERRSWWLLRIESVGYVIVGAIALLAFAFLVVLAPFIWYKLIQYVPTLKPLSGIVTFTRYVTAAVVIVIALTILHLWLPAGRRTTAPKSRPASSQPFFLWLVSGAAFGRYLAEYARLCIDVCWTGVGDDRADFSLRLRVDLHFRRRTEFSNHAAS